MIIKQAKEWAKRHYLPIPDEDDAQGIKELLMAYEDAQTAL